MIPAEYLDQNKRLKWEYFFHDGETDTPAPMMHAAMAKAKEAGSSNFLASVLPYMVPSETWDRTHDANRVPYDWLRENCSGAWALWEVPDMSVIGTVEGLYFEEANDALLFKKHFQD